MTNTTVAVRVVRAAGALADDLTVERTEPSELKAGQVRVRCHHLGVNYWDIMQRNGQVPLGPGDVPGVEGAGTVLEAANDVVGLTPGTRVAWSKVPGSYADQIQADAGWFVPIPDGVETATAAAVLMQGVTADYLLEAVRPLAATDTVAVLAAAGGVGGLLVQRLTADGVEVCGIVGSEAKVPLARELGASTVLVDGDDLVERVRETYANGVDVVFDGNGGPETVRAFDILDDRGALVLFGTASGPLPDISLNDLGRGSFAVTRVAGKHYVPDQAAWRHRAQAVLASVEGKRIAPHVDQVLPLHEAAVAHQRMERRENRGKLLLQATDAG